MSADQLVSLASFAFATSITPGPNNLMLMMSGANFGLRRTLPHWLGVALGFVVMTFAIGLGLAALLERSPSLRFALQVCGIGYMLWLAYRLASSHTLAKGHGRAIPLTFLQAAAFQWANPKAWAMALSAIGVYAASGSPAQVALVAVVFGLINFPCVGVWVSAGQKLRGALQDERKLRIFNGTLAALLVLSVAPTVWGLWSG
jgi:threonine/homoserine/homoserine lactone efflux protein